MKMEPEPGADEKAAKKKLGLMKGNLGSKLLGKLSNKTNEMTFDGLFDNIKDVAETIAKMNEENALKFAQIYASQDRLDEIIPMLSNSNEEGGMKSSKEGSKGNLDPIG